MPKPPLPTGRRNYADTGVGSWLGEVRATTRERDRGADRQHDRADRINNSEDHIASRWRRRISDREQRELRSHTRCKSRQPSLRSGSCARFRSHREPESLRPTVPGLPPPTRCDARQEPRCRVGFAEGKTLASLDLAARKACATSPNRIAIAVRNPPRLVCIPHPRKFPGRTLA
jgi:hypothetical protein